MLKKYKMTLSGNIYIVKDGIVIKRVHIVSDSGSFQVGSNFGFLTHFEIELPITDDEKIEFL